MTWLPEPGELFVVEEISAFDTEPVHEAGEVFVCDAGFLPVDAGIPHALGDGTVYLTARYGNRGSSRVGTYCIIRPHDPVKETLWRLGRL